MTETRRANGERNAIIAVCVVVALVYASLINAPPLIWDDDLNIFENPYYVGGRWWSLWGQPYFGMYIPVTSTIWAAVYQLSHGEAWPFRLLNIVLHVGNVLLFASLLRARLRQWSLASTIAVPVAVAIFALHPQQTAVVSWISGARDLAATFFALAALRVHRSDLRHRVLLATLLFACAMLSKPSVVALPLVLVALAWWFDRDRIRSALLTAGVWVLMAAGVVAVTRAAQSTMFSVAVPLLHRPFIALDAMGFYLIKTVWPFPLAADYGRRPDVVWSTPSMMVPTILVALAAIVVFVLAVRRDPRYRIGLVWAVLLLPVLGLVPFAYQRISTVADHYNYMPLAGLAALVALLVARTPRMNGRAGWVLFGVLLTGYAGASWSRTADWKDNQRFFDDMLRKNPKSFTAVINIAAVQCDKGNWQLGLSTIQQTALVARTDAAFIANETYCLFRAGRLGEVFARQDRLKEPSVVASLDSNPAASAVLASAFAGAFIAEDQPLKAFAYLCQAQAVSPQDLDIAHNVATARDDLRRRGREVTCRGRIPWPTLAEIVKVLD